MTRLNRLAFHFSMTTLTLLAIALTISLYWRFSPVEIVEYFNEPFPVKADAPLRPGDILRYEVDYCRHLPHPFEITRELHNDIIITLEPVQSRFPLGCRHSIVARDRLPDHIPPGHYKLVQTIQTTINPLRIETFSVETEMFEVVADETNQ